MNTMKLFAKLFVAFVLLFIFVTFMSKAFIRTAYTPIYEYEVVKESPKIEITEAKATKMNGYVKGVITNNTDHKLDNEYIIVDCYSEYDNNIATKYLKVSELEVGQSEEFNVQYRCQGAESLKISTTDQTPDIYNVNFELTDMQKFGLIIGGMLVYYYLPVGYLFGIFPV